jgi:hypothetical protein
MIDEALLILAPLKPTLVVVMEPEPGFAWARCPDCLEAWYIKRARGAGKRCRLTPRCTGVPAIWLECLCAVCGRLVTTRRREADTRFCSMKCEKREAS